MSAGFQANLENAHGFTHDGLRVELSRLGIPYYQESRSMLIAYLEAQQRAINTLPNWDEQYNIDVHHQEFDRMLAQHEGPHPWTLMAEESERENREHDAARPPTADRIQGFVNAMDAAAAAGPDPDSDAESIGVAALFGGMPSDSDGSPPPDSDASH